VTVVVFGHDHNLPEYSHNHWGLCGPAGTLEIPDSGWPDSPATAGNSVAFGTPIVEDILFPFYYVEVWGFAGAYYCTDFNPVGGPFYTGFVDDSNPPVFDECDLFGCVRWYEEGYNETTFCGASWGACCYEDGTCTDEHWMDCMVYGDGIHWIPHALCETNARESVGACCLPSGSCRMRIEQHCLWSDGAFVGKGIPCDPDPCDITSSVPGVRTEAVTWGRIKSTYQK
jgi:hypothetical protein